MEKEFGARTIELKGPIALGELKELIRTKQIDYFISSAGFARLLGEEGVRELVIYRPGPNERIVMNSDRHFLSLKTKNQYPRRDERQKVYRK